MKSTKYDVVIVGAGIAGPAIAYALSASSRLRQTLSKENQRTKPLRILLIDSKLAKPNRIVGEFLQPGGVHALEKIGLEGALEGIDAIRTLGYCILRPKPSSSTTQDGRTEFEKVHIPYPPGEAGRSFHHGEFVHSLRQHASRAEGVTLLEGTVKSEGVVYCPHTGRVLGVRVKSSSDSTAEEQVYLAKLTIFATGSSAFRRALYLPSSTSSESGSTQQVTRNLETKTLGTFFGLILPNPPDKKYILPLYEHGCVILIPNSAGPVLLYQVGTNDTRILIDIPHDSPYKRDVQSYIRNVLLPNLPTEDLRRGLQTLVDEADNDEKRAGRLDLKGVANPFFPAPPQGGGRMREGALLLGDAWNQRHPLTGGGMTVAFGDVVTLASELILAEKQLFGEPSDKEVPSSNGIKVEETEVSLSEHDEEWTLGDWRVMDDIFDRWWWTRRGYASTINILSVALYDLFGGSSTNLETLQTGCFKYLGLGGECTNGPVTLLGGIAPRPFLLFRHFFTVAFYSLWVMFMHERPVLADEDSEEYSNGHAAHENGHSNGHANGHSNGHANGYANGHSNGLKKRHANGSNGHANGDSKAVTRTVVKMARPSVLQWPLLFFRSFAVFWTACVVFGPLMWTEIKWW